MPNFSMPQTGILPPMWNTILDESGDSGGIIKRKGSGAEPNASTTTSHLVRETDIMEADEDEQAKLLERLDKKCFGGNCHCKNNN